MTGLLTRSALLDDPHRDLGPRSNVEFGQDVLDVISGGLIADDERLCYLAIRVRPDEASSIQEVQFLRRQGPASQRQSSFALCKATSMTKRKQSDRQAATRVK